MSITTHRSKDLMYADIVMPNDELEHWAKVYNDSPKIKSRMTFLEFATMPEKWLEASEGWPEHAWLIDFAPNGAHHKLWVNELASNRTLLVTVVDKRDGDKSITSSLNLAKRTSQVPEAILVDRSNVGQLIAVKKWCRQNNIKLKTRAANQKPQLKEVA